MSSRSAWVIGIAGIVGVALVTLNTLPGRAPGSRGVSAGQPLPAFAVPLATSSRRCKGRPCDANVATRADAGEAGSRPACEVRGPDVLNSCELAERGPVAIAFLTTRSEGCERQVDVMERLRSRFPRVRLAAVAVRGDPDALVETIRRRGWRMPVGYDRDGAVASAYSVVSCPAVTFARRGGKVASSAVALLGERALARRLEALGG